ncbi:MAG: carboxypeptidase regulatory-like domain-containing protein [Acidobacteriota bacterium]
MVGLSRHGGLGLLIAFLALSVAFAQTQITTGTIQARITDESGGVIPGASVTVRNLDTNLERNLVSADDGRFIVPQLPPGRYSVTVTQPGFATLIQSDLTLTVGQAITLDLVLTLSTVQQTITVSGSPTVDTTKIESSSTLNQRTIEGTPVLGRKFEDLLTLTPGVSVVQGPDGDEINFNGQRGIFNNFSLDGGDYNNGFFGEQAGGQRAAIDITMDAIQEFQVIATGASAEFGRTAGGIVNVVTKSGTNDVHGTVFHFQRLEDLAANTSDGKPLKDFHREQFGGTIGGPLVRDKAFLFGAFEQLTGDLTRENLGGQIGPDPCSVSAPNILEHEALINANVDCQRLALLEFFRNTRNSEEGAPIERPLYTSAVLLKFDWNIDDTNNISSSYSFTRTKKENETFDVATYGTSANGTEGPGRIQSAHFNLFSTIAATRLNEAHFTYSRENRARSTTESNIPADTGIGFGTAFRFGNPFFLQPDVDELFWRTQVRDNFTLIAGSHTVKFGGEWVHSNNSQVFRGFFTGRYIFADLLDDTQSVSAFLRYASPASLGAGFGPSTLACFAGGFSDSCEGLSPLLLYLQGASLRGPTTDAAGASEIANEEFAFFIQDKWQVVPNFTLSLGLRWEAQLFPDPVVPPSQTAYGFLLGDPRFPSDGTLPDENEMFQPRLGFAWDVGNNRKSVLRGSASIFNARQNMLTQVGSITTNGVQQQTIAGGVFANPTVTPTWPNVVVPADLPEGQFPLFTGVRVFSSDYRNPRIYSLNASFEQQVATDWTAYVDFTWNKGVYLTRFVNINADGRFSPQLGEVALTQSSAKSLYRGVTVGMRKRYSQGFQLEWNYTYSRDKDDDSNERDPFTFPAFDPNNFNLDYSRSNRDIAHKFNLVSSVDLPAGFDLNLRVQGRSAQPITPQPRVVDGVDLGRNSIRKNNEFFSFDWRVQRFFDFGEHYSIVAIAEMFNTFNNDNNINPLTTPGLFNFDGFLRQGVGDPRQLQLAVKFVF